MKYPVGLPLFLLFFAPAHALFATALSPWLGNVFEFEADLAYLYGHSSRVQTPLGSFSESRNTSELECSLSISPWQNWSVETELYFGSSPDIAFTYEAFLFTGRYLWLDELSDDLFNLAVGITLSLPEKRFFTDFSYGYHGDVNAEGHMAIGKESLRESRYWLLGGLGISNRGSGWVHGIAATEWHPFPCLSAGLVVEALFGLGSHNIEPSVPFEGYASIAHRTIDMGAFVSYPLGVTGTLTLQTFYNLYAHNFPQHAYGVQIDFLIPFSF